MKKLRRVVVCMVLFFGFSLVALAASDSVVDAHSVQGVAPSFSSQEQEIQLLRAQLELRRDYQAELLQTVYWALGGVFVLVSLLLGFGWFGSFKVYERDKKSLKEEVEADAKSYAAELRENLKQSSSDLRNEVLAAADKKIDNRFWGFDESVKKVGDRLFQLELAQEKEKMYSNTSNNMALTSALNLLSRCYKAFEDEVPELLKFIAEKLDEGGKFTAREHARVSEVLDELPSKYITLTDRVRKGMSESEIF